MEKPLDEIKKHNNVIIINMFSGTNGFPSQKENDELLTLVLPNPEEFELAEERRLMYVAVTRAKERLFLLAPSKATSTFIKKMDKLLVEEYNMESEGKSDLEK